RAIGRLRTRAPRTSYTLTVSASGAVSPVASLRSSTTTVGWPSHPAANRASAINRTRRIGSKISSRPVKLTVLAVGKLRDAWVKAGWEEYEKRVRARLPLEVIEVKAAADLARRVPARARLWVLDERGRELTSDELAAALKRHMDAGESVAFVVGGA